MAKIRNGARYDKPIPSERDAVLGALKSFVAVDHAQWLEVLPLTGLYTEYIAHEYPDAELTFTEMSEQVLEFVRDRNPRELAVQMYPDQFYGRQDRYDVISCIFRLESLPRAERRKLLAELRRRVKPGGQMFVTFVNRRSYYTPLRWMRARLGHAGVEYALAPDPSLGPFRGALPREIHGDLRATGWVVRRKQHCFAVPPADEIAYRAGRKGRKVGLAGEALAQVGRAARIVEPVLAPLARLHAWDVVPGSGV